METDALSLPLTRAAEGLPRYRFTVRDVDRMVEAGVLPETGRWELIDGEIAPMAAMRRPHSRMTALITTWAQSELGDAFDVLPGVTVQLSEFSRLDPDLVVADRGTDRIVSADAVRLVVEIADTTRRRDLAVKAPLYAAAGIPELWVIDLEANTIFVHRDPSPTGGWGERVEHGLDAVLSPLCAPDVSLSIAALG